MTPRCIVYSALGELAKIGQFDAEQVPGAMKALGIDAEKGEPMSA